jgi:hypothetical protein
MTGGWQFLLQLRRIASDIKLIISYRICWRQSALMSEAEDQVLELLPGHDVPEFKLTVECTGGVWDVTLSAPPNRSGRGTGATFAEAWENIAPMWA